MAFLKSFWDHQSGNIAISAAIVALPLLVGAGAAIDMARASHVKTVLQNAADTAALAGATAKNKSDTELKEIVEDFLAANGVQDVLGAVTVVKQGRNIAKGTYSVSISGTMKASLMQLVGFKELDIGAYAEVNIRSQAVELALVLDNTGSMAGSKIANLKTAATNLVNIMQSDSASDVPTKIAVVPFAEYVNVGISSLGQSWIDASTLRGQPFMGCVGSRKSPQDKKIEAFGIGYPAVANEPCNIELLPLTTDMNAVRTRINSMVSRGATYIPTGLLWGWNVLDASAPFTEGRTKAALKEMNGRKVLVLMTDGENTISPSYPTHDGRDIATSNSTLTDICTNVKKDEIEVYTVSFMVPSETVKTLLEKCATSNDHYFDADNSTQLNAAFAEIAKDLASIRLTN